MDFIEYVNGLEVDDNFETVSSLFHKTIVEVIKEAVDRDPQKERDIPESEFLELLP